MDYLKDVLSKIINDNSKVKINYKKDKSGGVYLYLNYRKTVNGVTKQETKRIGITILGSKESKKDDLYKIKMAMEYRDDFEMKLLSGQDIFKNKAESIFLNDYLDMLITNYTIKNSSKIFKSLKFHLKNFKGDFISFSMVDKKFCLDFAKYLNNTCNKSAYHYLGKFKQVLYKAIDDQIISDLPFLRNFSLKHTDPKREFLTEDELKILYNFPYSNIDYKNAFIFSCFTGLRFIDLFNLKFNSIDNGYLEFVQVKTKERLKMKLHNVALKIIEDQLVLNKSGNVFNIASYEIWRRNVIKFCKLAGINKNITGHCARHTFATLCLTYEIPITTIAKLLGHTDIKHTQTYAKLVDKKKDEAIDKLPDLE